MPFLEYGPKEIEYLSSRDKQLGAAIERIGMIKREIIPDPFTALVFSIVSQQVSKQAAAKVSSRLKQLVHDLTPEAIAGIELLEIKACGMSERKAVYIKELADTAISGRLDFKSLQMLPDNDVVEQLSALRGVGVWTAEMLLIFSLGRPDIVSFRDLAIRRGMMNLYGLNELPRETFEEYRKQYTPYGSVASLYLWALSAE